MKKAVRQEDEDLIYNTIIKAESLLTIKCSKSSWKGSAEGDDCIILSSETQSRPKFDKIKGMWIIKQDRKFVELNSEFLREKMYQFVPPTHQPKMQEVYINDISSCKVFIAFVIQLRLEAIESSSSWRTLCYTLTQFKLSPSIYMTFILNFPSI